MLNLQKIGGRRFIVTVLTWAAVTILVYLGKIDNSTYSLVTLGTIGAFITGNVVESVKSSATNN